MARPKRVNGKWEARLVVWQGEERKLCDLAKEYNLNMRTITTRIDRHGWDLAKALETPAKQQKPTPPSVIEERRFGTRTKIINNLMETFYAEPERFEQWCKDKMDEDYEKFYKQFVMPFLPKDQNRLLDRGNEKAVINIEFHGGSNPQPPMIQGEFVEGAD